jgi:succinyl-diaminopimelate desuccinylase
MLKDKKLLEDLISCQSITPSEAGCINIISSYLGCEPRLINRNQTTNAYYEFGHKGPLFLFTGHIDVVEPGPLNRWINNPFTLTENENKLYARGIVDMKGAVYAFCSAFKNIEKSIQARVGILLTSDEEGSGIDGLAFAIPKLKINANWALVGEPTSVHTFGDTFKHERRGSYHFHITIQGKQGHIAYPTLAKNPSDELIHFLETVKAIKASLEPGNVLSIYSIETSTHTVNMIPESLTIKLNLRYQNSHVIAEILNSFKAIDPNVQGHLGAQPYSSNPTLLKSALKAAIKDTIGINAKSSHLGGTSDARFLQPIAKEIIEFGLLSCTAHQINEMTPVNDLQNLQIIYQKLLLTLLENPGNQT